MTAHHERPQAPSRARRPVDGAGLHPHRRPQGGPWLLQLQATAGNRAASGLVGPLQRSPATGAPAPGGAPATPQGADLLDQPREAPRTATELAELAEDCFGAIVGNETGGNVRESAMHTASGVSASYASAGQHIASKTVAVLQGFSGQQLAELDLTRKDLTTATKVFAAVRTVWTAAVEQRTATTVDDLRARLGATVTATRLLDADLERMLRGGELFADLSRRVAEAGGRKHLKQDKQARAAVAAELATTELARELDIRATDANAYIRKGYREDLAAWMRVAITRPPADGEDDRLGARIQAAAEGEGGWRMPRVDVTGAVTDHAADHPLASDLEILRAAVEHHAQGADASYHTLAEAGFRELRALRASGTPWSPPIETPAEPPGGGTVLPASGDWDAKVREAMAPGLDLLIALGAVGAPATLSTSVGPGAGNAAADVRAVAVRLMGAGFLTVPADGAALADAIVRFQAERAGFAYPDGRVDPGGKTLAALNAVTAPTTPATPGGGGGVPAVEPPVTDQPTGDRPGPAGDQPRPIGGTTTPAAPGGTVMSRLLLIGSVGAGGLNHPMDAALVRARLEELGVPAGATDAELADAIKRFQARTFNLKSSKCDGRVDPGGPTHQALAAGARPGAGRSTADLDALVAGLDHHEVVALRAEIAAAEATEATIAEDLHEEQGEARDRLVTRIGELRRRIDGLVLAGLDQAEADGVRAWAHRRVNALSPYYSQGRNVNFLEGDETRTCNLTALAMALEARGRSGADYAGDLERLRSIRRFEGTGGKYRYQAAFDKGDDQVPGDDVLGLRLPDFLQLAMVDRNMSKGMDMFAAVRHAWDDILFAERMQEVAARFGVAAWVRAGLGGSGTQLRARYQDALGGALDQGHQIVMLTPGHFVRLEAITDAGLVVDDPGRHTKKNKLVRWSDASGYALKMLIIA